MYMVKLLIVEDNDFERNALQNYIDWDILGIRQVETAFNGLDGMEKAIALMPDIIISDVKMPGMNGLEMAKNIIRFCPDAKFIFSSGHEEVGLIQEAMEVRAYSYLIKPLKQEELIAVIKKITSILVDEKLSSLEKNKIIAQFQQHLPFLQSRFLEELILSGTKAEDAKTLSVRANELKLRMIGMYQLALIEFDFGAESDIFHRSELLNVVLYNLQSSGSGRNVIFIKSPGNGVIALLHTLVKEDKEGTETVNGIEAELKAMSVDHPFQYIIGVSELFQNPEELNRAYKQAIQVTSRKIQLGFGHIVHYSECKEVFAAVSEPEPIDLKSAVSRIISLVCEGESCEQELNQLVNGMLTDPGSSMDDIRSWLIFLFSSLSMQLTGVGESVEKMAEEETVIYKQIIHARTIPEMLEYAGKILNAISAYMDRKKLNKDDYIIKEILHILNHDYQKPITLTYLSDRVYLSPNYLRILFKEKMNISIQEYLTNLRICKAKELLKQTKHKVHEIGEMVGYENSTYFNIVFKNYIQMTPKEYRKKFR